RPGRAIYTRGRTDAADADLGRKGNCEFTDKVVDRRLAHIVSLASLFGNDCSGRACENHARVEPLFAQDSGGLLTLTVIRRNINVQGQAPLTITYLSVG